MTHLGNCSTASFRDFSEGKQNGQGLENMCRGRRRIDANGRGAQHERYPGAFAEGGLACHQSRKYNALFHIYFCLLMPLRQHD